MKINLSPFVIGTLVLGTFVAPLSVYAQGNELNHGQDTPADGRGDRIRGLPPRAPTGGAVTTGNGINYHNGPVLHTINLYYILYGNWTSLDSTGPAILNSWATSIGDSPYFNINTTYGDTTGNVPNAVTFMGTYTDTGTLGTSLSDASIATLVMNAINHGYAGSPNTPGVADPNGLYMVLTAPGVKETSGFLTQYCGWHWWGSIANGAIQSGAIIQGDAHVQFAFIGNAAGPNLGSCAAQTSSSPNGDPGADAMISVMAHELEETATDPQGTGWYDSNGDENGDKCAWTFGSLYISNNAYANMALGGKNYLIQQNWVNAGGGYCALSYTTASPDFSVSVSGSQTVSPGGTSGNYTLTATRSNGFTGPVTWTITPPSGISASTPVVANTATFTLTASSGLAPGTYSIPITGAYGSLSHSTSATLVVSAPTFTLGITPASQTATRPGGGSTTVVKYTVTATAVGGFTSNVSLSVTGGTTGVALGLNPNPLTISGGSGSSTLTVTLSNSAKKGNRTFTVTGVPVGGGASKQATATLLIH